MIQKRVKILMTLILLLGGVLLSLDAAISASSSGESSSCIASPEVIEDLKNQRKEIESKEAALTQREEELKKKEDSLKEELNKLDEIKKQILGLKQQLDQKQEEQMSKFIETLEKMSPKATAKVLESVDELLAVQVMSRISTEKLAKVMNVMPPAKSSKLSELLTIGRASEARVPASQEGGQKQ